VDYLPFQTSALLRKLHKILIPPEIASIKNTTPLDRSPDHEAWTTCLSRPWSPTQSLSSPHLLACIVMGKNNRSPAKTKRSILRLLNYKKDYLADCWGTEIEINHETKEIVWKASEILNLTLIQNIRIIETRGIFNPGFPSLSISEKLQKFQNMWKPDHNCFSFFSCMHHHLRRNTAQCEKFCSGFSSPICERLAYFLSTNN
jgi:hypothetical protein